MKKFIFSLATLATFSFAAIAQTAPEGFIAACPDVPSEKEMIEFALGKAEESPYEYYFCELEKVKASFEDFSSNLSSSLRPELKSELKKEKVSGTGVTLGKAQKMSDEQLKALANASVASQMSSMGLSMEDIKALQNGSITEEELINKLMVKQSGGMTTKDIEAMSNMTEQQRMEFMLESKLAEETNDKTKANIKQSNKNAALTSVVTKIGENEQKTAELLQKCNALRTEANQWGRDFYDKNYRARIDNILKEIDALEKKMIEGEQTEAEARNNASLMAQEEGYIGSLNRLVEEFWTKAMPVWRNAFIQSQSILENEVLSLCTETGRLYDKAYELSKNPQYLGGEARPLYAVSLYLEGAETVCDYNFGDIAECRAL